MVLAVESVTGNGAPTASSNQILSGVLTTHTSTTGVVAFVYYWEVPTGQGTGNALLTHVVANNANIGTFQKRASTTVTTLANGQFGASNTAMEFWWAPYTGALTGAVITANAANIWDDACCVSFLVYGPGLNINSPFDTDTQLPIAVNIANTTNPASINSTSAPAGQISTISTSPLVVTFGGAPWNSNWGGSVANIAGITASALQNEFNSGGGFAASLVTGYILPGVALNNANAQLANGGITSTTGYNMIADAFAIPPPAYQFMNINKGALGTGFFAINNPISVIAQTAPIAILQDGATNRNSGAATGTTGTAVSAGSTIVCAISGITGTILTLIDSAGNSYLKAAQHAKTNFDIEIWYCLNVITLPLGGTFTATTSDAGQYSLNVAASLSQCSGVDAVGYNHSTGNTTTLSTTTATATIYPHEIAFAALNGLGAGSYTEDANWTELATSPNSTNPLAYKYVNNKTTVTWAPSFSSSAVDSAIATFIINTGFIAIIN